MDADRFDILARSLSTPRSRRSLTRLLGGLGLGGGLAVWGATETLAEKLNAGELCTRGRQCKTGKCIGLQGHKTCSCSRRHECSDSGTGVTQCIHGGCFHSESCSGCAPGPQCGAGLRQCFCSQTVDSVPVCFASEDVCTGAKACDTNGDCPTGRGCITTSCLGVVGTCPLAVCQAPCPVDH
jgi:hypothetical protein